ncbi:MAG: phosphosulfolactate synthase [Bacteroidia bacterium]|nr:MAG: phosphosulfolactate synthase [Bacteroidia bacterium]
MLDHLPNRMEKPRSNGVTMVMDKGLGVRQAHDLAETAGHLIDFVKLGFGTSYVSKNVKEKVSIYRQHNIRVYVGGTLLEAFVIRDQLDEYQKYIDAIGCDAAEVSDGCIRMEQEQKCNIIKQLGKHFMVVSEVGAKDEDVTLQADEWISAMRSELEAGSSFVIGEARESGTVGIYGKNGSADTGLIDHILQEIPPEKIIWEAPAKQQQIWFIRKLGALVNLGNISPAEIIPLETLRLGLRGDTFFENLPAEFLKYKL